MPIRRRQFTALLALALSGVTRPALAQAWPAGRPIRLIVGYPPGGGIDFAARTVQRRAGSAWSSR